MNVSQGILQEEVMWEIIGIQHDNIKMHVSEIGCEIVNFNSADS
jgi:hypothetical protein